jgi:hypothetical protein
VDNSAAAILGDLIGYVLAAAPMYLVGLLIGLMFKSREPNERAAFAAAITWALVFALTIKSMGFGWGIVYAPAAIIVFLLLKRHYLKLWEPEAE